VKVYLTTKLVPQGFSNGCGLSVCVFVCGFPFVYQSRVPIPRRCRPWIMTRMPQKRRMWAAGPRCGPRFISAVSGSMDWRLTMEPSRSRRSRDVWWGPFADCDQVTSLPSSSSPWRSSIARFIMFSICGWCMKVIWTWCIAMRRTDTTSPPTCRDAHSAFIDLNTWESYLNLMYVLPPELYPVSRMCTDNSRVFVYRCWTHRMGKAHSCALST
jgi:hypothetical protein